MNSDQLVFYTKHGISYMFNEWNFYNILKSKQQWIEFLYIVCVIYRTIQYTYKMYIASYTSCYTFAYQNRIYIEQKIYVYFSKPIYYKPFTRTHIV